MQVINGFRVFATLPFSEAILKQTGDYVSCGGPRRILEVVRTGRNEPYYRLEGIDPYDWKCLDGPGLVSWQVCGDARV